MAVEDTTETESTRPAWLRWGLPALALLLVVGLVVGWFLTRGQGTDVQPAPESSPTVSQSEELEPEPPTAPASPVPTEEQVPAPGPTSGTDAAPPADGACQPLGEGFQPTRFQLDQPKANEPVLSLGEDSDGHIAAPPKNQPRTASWWNKGPRPGSTKGKVVLSIHTYRTGKALGNAMYTDNGPTMKPGTRLKLMGADGQVACYEFVEAKKVMVSDYDPKSDIMVDFDGDPMVAIVICWDFRPSTEDWDSRVFFYFKPVA